VSDAPRVVLLRPLGLGDFLAGVPAYRAIARAFPDHRRLLAAPAALAPLATLVSEIDALVPTEPLVPLGPALQDADVAIDLHGRGPASHEILLAARPRRLVAFANPAVPASAGFAPWREDEHERDRWCRMLAHAGIAADPEDLHLSPPAPRAGSAGATVIHPGAKSASRRWPPERFAAVARAEREAGRRVLVTGDAADRQAALALATAAGLDASAVLAGTTTLAELAAVVGHAGAVVCGDTGVAHLATAFGTPAVMLFGPTAPATWGPPVSPRHRVLWHGTTGDPHGTTLDPGLARIGVDRVLRELARLPARELTRTQRR